MKEFDCVQIIVEREKYAKFGVHKGMQGWICFNDNSDGTWLVNFPQRKEKCEIATILVKERDLRVIPKLDAQINEEIKLRFKGVLKP